MMDDKIQKTIIPMLAFLATVGILWLGIKSFSKGAGFLVVACLFIVIFVVIGFLIFIRLCQLNYGRHRYLFTVYLRSFVRMQMPLDKTLSSLGYGGSVGRAFRKISAKLSRGMSLSSSIRGGIPFLPSWYSRMMEIGERHGNLEDILDRLMDVDQRKEEREALYMKTLAYPICVLAVVSVVMTFMFLFIVPKYKLMYDGMGINLPGLTQFFVDACFFLDRDLGAGPVLIMSLPVLFIGIQFILYLIYPPLNVLALLHLIFPWMNMIYYKLVVAEWASVLSLLLQGGETLENSLTEAANVSNNPVFKKHSKSWAKEVKEGKKLSDVMKKSWFVPRSTLWQVKSSESSGNLERTLQIESVDLVSEVKRKSGMLIRVFSVLLIVAIGIFVGTFCTAMFLPLLKIISNMGA